MWAPKDWDWALGRKLTPEEKAAQRAANLEAKKASKRKKTPKIVVGPAEDATPKTPPENRIGYGMRTDKTEAKHALGASGGVTGPRSNHPFGRWLQKRESYKKMQLSVEETPKQPRREGPRNLLAEEMADEELQSSQDETERNKKRELNTHLLFRRHHYMPTMGVGVNKGQPQIEAGAYARSPYKGGGLSNMANDPNVRN